MNTLVVLEAFEIKGRGMAYIVEAGDPPFMCGDRVLLDGVEHVVTGVEMQPTAVPRYVINGKQSLLLEQAEACSHPDRNMGGFCTVCGEDLHPDLPGFDPVFAAQVQRDAKFNVDYLKLYADSVPNRHLPSDLPSGPA